MDLKEYLDRNHLNVDTFAAKCKLSRAAIYQYLKGTVKPRKKGAWAIERATGGKVTAKQMMGMSNG